MGKQIGITKRERQTDRQKRVKISHKKKWNIDTCYNVNEPQKHDS